LGALGIARDHVLDAVEGLEDVDLRRQMLPSGWSCLGLINHLALDVERLWFHAVTAGDQGAVDDLLGSSRSAWDVGDEVSADEVIGTYRANIERANAILAVTPFDAAPAWWPESFFGSWRLHTVRNVVLHVVIETATHAGHLDVARELIDGTQHLVIGE
jgi:uncharacterized damage-inducible protein DinB